MVVNIIVACAGIDYEFVTAIARLFVSNGVVAFSRVDNDGIAIYSANEIIAATSEY